VGGDLRLNRIGFLPVQISATATSTIIKQHKSRPFIYLHFQGKSVFCPTKDTSSILFGLKYLPCKAQLLCFKMCFYVLLLLFGTYYDKKKTIGAKG
jgi:hypothetical protein